MAASNKITIFTDGACKGNPGKGGWAAVIVIDGVQYLHSGGEPRTTNNRMELMGAIKGIEAAPPDREIVLYSDSTYLVNTMTKGWKRNANRDLWAQLDRLCKERRVDWKWVRGHNGTPGNEMADRLASMEAGLFQRGTGGAHQKASSGTAVQTPGQDKPSRPFVPYRKPRRTQS